MTLRRVRRTTVDNVKDTGNGHLNKAAERSISDAADARRSNSIMGTLIQKPRRIVAGSHLIYLLAVTFH